MRNRSGNAELIILLLIISISCIMTMLIVGQQCDDNWKARLVKAGLAHYELDATTGKSKFILKGEEIPAEE